jgi:hypothetical protein
MRIVEIAVEAIYGPVDGEVIKIERSEWGKWRDDRCIACTFSDCLE